MSGSLVSRRHEAGASPMMASLAPAHGESEAPHWRTVSLRYHDAFFLIIRGTSFEADVVHP